MADRVGPSSLDAGVVSMARSVDVDEAAHTPATLSAAVQEPAGVGFRVTMIGLAFGTPPSSRANNMYSPGIVNPESTGICTVYSSHSAGALDVPGVTTSLFVKKGLDGGVIASIAGIVVSVKFVNASEFEGSGGNMLIPCIVSLQLS